MDTQTPAKIQRSGWKDIYLHPELFVIVLVMFAELLFHRKSGVVGYAIYTLFFFALGAFRFIIFPKHASEFVERDIKIIAAYLFFTGCYCIVDEIVFIMPFRIIDMIKPARFNLSIPAWAYVYCGAILFCGIILIVKRHLIIKRSYISKPGMIRLCAMVWLFVNTSLLWRAMFLVHEAHRLINTIPHAAH